MGKLVIRVLVFPLRVVAIALGALGIVGELLEELLPR